MSHLRICPDCESSSEVSRRDFLKTAGVAALAVGATPLLAHGAVSLPAGSTPESVAKLLFESLKTEARSKEGSIGVSLAQKNDEVVVVRVQEGAPASRSG